MRLGNTVMAIYVYSNVSGVLVSYCPGDNDPVADDATLANQGMSVVRGLPPLAPDRSNFWDAATRTVLSTTPPPKAKPITAGDWILRFTPDEVQAILASNDKVVKHFVFALGHSVDLDLSHQSMINGANYLVSVGLLTSARAAIIMA